MPKEYVNCWKSYVARGVPVLEAKSRCAAAYQKRHGVSVKEAHSRGIATFDQEALKYDEKMTFVILNATKPVSEMIVGAIGEYDVGFESVFGDSLIATENIEELFADGTNIITLVAAKVGSVALHKGYGVILQWTAESLNKIASSWIGGTVGVNHMTRNGGKILHSRYCAKSENLYHTVMVTDELKSNIIRNWPQVGASIEANNVTFNEDQEIVSADGTGVTFAFYPVEALCSPEEGCKILGAREIMEKEVEKTGAQPCEKCGKEPCVCKVEATDNPTPKEKPKEKPTEDEVLATKQEEITTLRTEIEEQNKKLEELETFRKETLSKKRNDIVIRLEAAGIDKEKYENFDMEALEVVATDVEALIEKMKDEKVEDAGAEGADLAPPKKDDDETAFQKIRALERERLGYEKEK